MQRNWCYVNRLYYVMQIRPGFMSHRVHFTTEQCEFKLPQVRSLRWLRDTKNLLPLQFVSATKTGFERRKRDLNPRAAINDLLPFQGSPFGQLGYFSSSKRASLPSSFVNSGLQALRGFSSSPQSRLCGVHAENSLGFSAGDGVLPI